MNRKFIFELPMSVRDYELDVQGIVNNANYLHYLEHTRHAFCKAAGLSFRDMHEQGIDPVLAHVALDYHLPLRSGDEFLSRLRLSRRGPLFVFEQWILMADGRKVLDARIEVACLENGRLTRGEVLAEAFKDFLD